jgi:spermidine/putrescine transport system substrate-binding protein
VCLAAGGLVLGVALGCRRNPPPPAPGEPTEAAPPGSAGKPPRIGGSLRLLMYSQYIDKALLADFKQRTDTTVEVHEYEDAETMRTQLQAGGGSRQYDVIVAPDYIIPTLAAAKLIRPFDSSRLPNARNVSARFLQQPFDPENRYSVPYQWGTNGLIVRKDKLPGFEPSWGAVFDPTATGGKFVLLDSIRDTLGAALIHLGKPASSGADAEVKAAGELVARAKRHPRCLGLSGSPDAVDKVLSGEAAVAMCYSGDAIRKILAEGKTEVAYVVPREGSIIWIDNMTVAHDAPNLEAAYAFVDFILEGPVGARLSNYLHYGCPNEAAKPMLSAADLANPGIYPPADVLAKLELLSNPPNMKTYDLVWTRARSR